MVAVRPQTVLLVSALAMASGWYLAVTVGPQSSQGVQTPSRGPRPLGVEATEPRAPYTEQLRLRLERQPPSPRPSRNPFVFQARRPVAAPSSEPHVDSVESADPGLVEPDTPARPAFVLSGMAMQATDGRSEYTAIVSDGSGLHFVKVGDELPGGFTVVAADETSVTLRDGSGGERTLRLP
jgi:hypothetical protein